LCRVSHTLVGKIRRQQHLETAFTDAGQQELRVNAVAPDRRRTVQRGSKRYEMNTGGIGKTTPSRGKKAGVPFQLKIVDTMELYFSIQRTPLL
jgi:hypothetical protein